ncbi:MAG: ribbon-helix-helix protein, CopG family [Candidatus Dormibacteria bacterium]
MRSDPPRDRGRAQIEVELAAVMPSYLRERTQISLTREERRVLNAEAARTGRSIAALIRTAIETVYGEGRSAADDQAAMRQSFGAREGHAEDGATWVERLRAGSRLPQP